MRSTAPGCPPSHHSVTPPPSSAPTPRTTPSGSANSKAPSAGTVTATGSRGRRRTSATGATSSPAPSPGSSPAVHAPAHTTSRLGRDAAHDGLDHDTLAVGRPAHERLGLAQPRAPAAGQALQRGDGAVREQDPGRGVVQRLELVAQLDRGEQPADGRGVEHLAVRCGRGAARPGEHAAGGDQQRLARGVLQPRPRVVGAIGQPGVEPHAADLPPGTVRAAAAVAEAQPLEPDHAQAALGERARGGRALHAEPHHDRVRVLHGRAGRPRAHGPREVGDGVRERLEVGVGGVDVGGRADDGGEVASPEVPPPVARGHRDDVDGAGGQRGGHVARVGAVDEERDERSPRRGRVGDRDARDGGERVAQRRAPLHEVRGDRVDPQRVGLGERDPESEAQGVRGLPRLEAPRARVEGPRAVGRSTSRPARRARAARGAPAASGARRGTRCHVEPAGTCVPS